MSDKDDATMPLWTGTKEYSRATLPATALIATADDTMRGR